MAKVARICDSHMSRQPRRPHFIAEWADRRGMKQVDVARETGADKSVVSRWFNGTSPGAEWQSSLAQLFQCEPGALFRPPADDWFSRFIANRDAAEIERIKATLETDFPRKQAKL